MVSRKKRKNLVKMYPNVDGRKLRFFSPAGEVHAYKYDDSIGAYTLIY